MYNDIEANEMTKKEKKSQFCNFNVCLITAIFFHFYSFQSHLKFLCKLNEKTNNNKRNKPLIYNY